jgi:hypothetical protein
LHRSAAKLCVASAVSTNGSQGGSLPACRQVLSLSSRKPAAAADLPDGPFVIAVGLLNISLAHEITRLALRSGLPLGAQACDERVLTRRVALLTAPGTFLSISSAFGCKLTTDTGSIRVPDGP